MPNILTRITQSPTPFYRFIRHIARWVCVLLLRTRVFGRHNVPRTGGVLIVSNHQSWIDPVIATVFLPNEAFYMARDTLFINRRLGGLISRLNAFPVRRGEADIGAIKTAMRHLRDGRMVIMFPEGTRTPDGRIHPMLPGLGAIAKKTRVPLVPTLIDGVYQAWPKGSLVPRFGDVIVHYGRPIMPDDYADMPADDLARLIRTRVLELQHDWHSRLPHRRLE